MTSEENDLNLEGRAWLHDAYKRSLQSSQQSAEWLKSELLELVAEHRKLIQLFVTQGKELDEEKHKRVQMEATWMPRPQQKKRGPKRKLTVEQVKEIRERKGTPGHVLAAQMEVSPSLISEIRSGVAYTDV